MQTQVVVSLSFRPQYRLLTKSDYSAVFDQVDIRISKGPFLLLCRKSSNTHPRLGLIIRKKFLKRAVDRNRLKRLARENFRLRQHQLPHLDIIFMNRSGSEHQSREDCAELVAGLFDTLVSRHG